MDLGQRPGGLRADTFQLSCQSSAAPAWKNALGANTPQGACPHARAPHAVAMSGAAVMTGAQVTQEAQVRDGGIVLYTGGCGEKRGE